MKHLCSRQEAVISKKINTKSFQEFDKSLYDKNNFKNYWHNQRKNVGLRTELVQYLGVFLQNLNLASLFL